MQHFHVFLCSFKSLVSSSVRLVGYIVDNQFETVVVVVASLLHAQPALHNYFSKTPKQPLIVVHDRASAFKQFKDARKCQDAGCSKQPKIVQIVSKKVFAGSRTTSGWEVGGMGTH